MNIINVDRGALHGMRQVWSLKLLFSPCRDSEWCYHILTLYASAGQE